MPGKSVVSKKCVVVYHDVWAHSWNTSEEISDPGAQAEGTDLVQSIT